MKKEFAFIMAFSLLLLWCMAVGCGYHRAGTYNPQLAGIATIAIPYFKNTTFEPEAEKIFTHAFINEFIKSKRLRVVSEPDADLILRGTIRKLIEDTIAYNRDDKALEYRMDVVLDVQLERRQTGEVLWKRKNVRHSEEFPVGDNIVLSEAAKRAALGRLAADLAERVHDSIIQGF
ncbi:MAG: LPS assembly lipoprotein LptE [Desulfobacterota bacterium]|nr:LPS assembly lipoprotein LptE [Thermodesulfobacteriota bacterium]